MNEQTIIETVGNLQIGDSIHFTKDEKTIWVLWFIGTNRSIFKSGNTTVWAHNTTPVFKIQY